MPNQSAAHTALVKLALEELAIAGYKAWKNNTGAKKTETGGFIKYGKKGSADILVVLAPWGRHVEAEAKTGEAKQNKNQKIHQNFVVENQGAAYFVFHDIPELLGAMRELECMRPMPDGGWAHTPFKAT